MKTLILSDRRSTHFKNINLCSLVKRAVEVEGNEVGLFILNGEQMRACWGCFDCWTKTPGQCIFTIDSANEICAQLVQADVVVLISELYYGGYSYDMKAFLDRSIPTLLPFFKIAKGEMRHKLRYKRRPALISIGYGGFSPEEAQIFIELTERNALNMRPPRHFVHTVQNKEDATRVCEELSSKFAQAKSPKEVRKWK